MISRREQKPIALQIATSSDHATGSHSFSKPWIADHFSVWPIQAIPEIFLCSVHGGRVMVSGDDPTGCNLIGFVSRDQPV